MHRLYPLNALLQTYASYPYNQWPTLSIIDGVLYGNGEHMNPAEGFAPAAGTQISFVVPPQGKGDKAWCGLVSNASIVLCLVAEIPNRPTRTPPRAAATLDSP